VYTSVLPREALAALVQISRREGQPLEAYTERGCYLEAETDLTRAHAAHLGLTPTIGDLLLVAEPVVSAVWVVAERDWSRLRRLTAAVEGVAIGTATTPWSPGTTFANLTCAGTAKSSALRWLAERYGVGVAGVAMVGDGENDLDAMQAAGLSIALGNAPEAVKGRAQRVVSGVDDGGLAEAIYVALRHDRRG
jgi:hydroxymethylpyrimidine pyrophosphatase-like HAD family hydrolase